jgi:hypothetical protein
MILLQLGRMQFSGDPVIGSLPKAFTIDQKYVALSGKYIRQVSY